MTQTIISGKYSIQQMERIFRTIGAKKIFLVCGSSFDRLPVCGYFEKWKVPYVRYSDFTSNPLYEDICNGVDLFCKEQCDAIVAVGGGSAIDVAKCVKLFSILDSSKNYLTQDYKNSELPMVAVPTTAGTGSESTHFAVIYYEGEKYSVAYESLLPDYAVLEPDLLKTLPIYQKKCTMLDALCQGIESWWSVNATDESIKYSRQAVSLIAGNLERYIYENDEDAAGKIMLAANYSGRAINITQTTAPHAMSYKLTSMYDLPHGHAVAICLPEVWRYMIAHPENCVDKRGTEHLNKVFQEIATCMKAESPERAIEKLEALLYSLGISHPHPENKAEDINILTGSVNETRLKNSPVRIPKDDIREIYDRVV